MPAGIFQNRNLLFICLLYFLQLTPPVYAQQRQEYKLLPDISYYSPAPNDSSDYRFAGCRLDLYYPVGKNGFTTVIWLHGGGLTGGEKYIPGGLKGKGIAVAAVEYRLFPKVKCPVYLQDAAAAAAWVFKNIADYGGDSTKIILSGHSAGAYLTLMLGLDKSWMAACGIDADRFEALVPFSPQVITHFTIRKERGIPETRPVIDEFAPLYHVKKDAPPVYLITGDREKELLGRYEENAYMLRMMKIAGNTRTYLYELGGFDHGSMVEPACGLLLKIANNGL